MANINEDNVSKLIPTLGDDKIGTYLVVRWGNAK